MELNNFFIRTINRIVSIAGFQIQKKKDRDNKNFTRDSLRGSLEQIKRLGLQPKTVIDVGAADGTFSLYESFPDAKHLLIEPLEEFKPKLDKIITQFKNMEYIIAAATKIPGPITFNVHADLVGSSIYKEHEDSDVNGVPRTVIGRTLDEICETRGLSGPYCLKVDVQGAECDVLAGATRVLKETEYVVLEVSLFRFFNNGPQLYDVIFFMKEQGFVAYDFFGALYRPLDNALAQVDIVFVKEKSIYRKDHFYATREQRAMQNRSFKKILE